ncbi:putative U3 small nucleolar RNA-associated protein 11 [Citrus sinensis]|uniref:U3 small nucleolar RNA-associated protein 11 n=2 Tax=Citrus sinensis TaxID=2711 RepID=A0ACB8NRI2_CITSI|nr:putative U3 small nucleolar RNA-associated protein 11 [Citrus sinensis]
MSSRRNAIPRRAHKERAQPQSRKKFGLLEKHKDYVVRAKAYRKKEETIRRLKEKAAFRNPDEFYLKMIKTKTVDGVHRLESEANKYTQEELMLMKTQDIGYILQKLQSERNKIEKLTTMLHSLDSNLSSRHVYYAEDREETKEIKYISGRKATLPVFDDIPDHIKRKTAASYRELEGRKKRVQELEKLFMDMSLQKELQKKGRKRKLHEEEIVCPSSKPAYKWRSERKRQDRAVCMKELMNDDDGCGNWNGVLNNFKM